MIIGIDGGGTHTRVAVSDLDGNILGFAKGGGVHPKKNKTPDKNVKLTIAEALKQAGEPLESVVKVVAGFAGLNRDADYDWAKSYLEMDGLCAEKIILNDAVIAQYGAFLGEPGIIAVSGTGSNVVGKTEAGDFISNRYFHHLPHASARYLSYFVIYDLISKKEKEENKELTEKVLRYWNVEHVEDLRQLAASGFHGYELNAIKELSNMAELVTDAATKGNEIALQACEKVAEGLMIGIRLVASLFENEHVKVSFAGSVANSRPVSEKLLRKMKSKDSLKRLTYQEPALTPVLGAILYGLRDHHMNPDIKMIENWKKEYMENH